MLGAYGILHGTGWASGMLGAGNVWFRLLIFFAKLGGKLVCGTGNKLITQKK